MDDIQDQIAELRQRIARVNQRYAARAGVTAAAPVAIDRKPAKYFVEEWLSGGEVRTELGAHFETEKLWERHKNHGSFELSVFEELPLDLLAAISGGSIAHSDCSKWAFLDTETTGLAGGAGTYAFLIGVGRITPQGFHLRQFFMREPGEEPSLLLRLTEYLNEFDVLVTYNGRTYDQPLLETRYRMARAKPPFDRMTHLDLLHGARRLWNLRFDSCRLVELENQVLGFERQGDLPGAMIPYVYFEFLRTKEAARVAPILHHNAFDILTLACLTAIVPQIFSSPENAPLAHGAEMVGMARWLRKAEELERAVVLFRRAINKGLRDELLFRTMWDIAQLERKLGRTDDALAVLTDLAASKNPYQFQALEELAKHHEHREKDLAIALEHTRAALALGAGEDMMRREERLTRKLAKRRQRGARLLET